MAEKRLRLLCVVLVPEHFATVGAGNVRAAHAARSGVVVCDWLLFKLLRLFPMGVTR